MAPLPSQIGRYEIKSLIGRGGMGDLYLAHDPNTNRLVALKLLNATLDSTELRERFAREARALAALNHPNIVNIYDTGEYDDAPFIVMEYVRGETLAEIIKRRAPLSVSQKLKLHDGAVRRAGAGARRGHHSPRHQAGQPDGRSAGAAEDPRLRDRPRGRGQPDTLRTADRGQHDDRHARATCRPSRSKAARSITAATSSPSAPSATSCSRTPKRSPAPTLDRSSARCCAGKPTPLASLVPGIDPEIDEIIQRALKKDPNKRYQDAATFEKALERVRARMGPDDAPALPPPPPAPPPHRAWEASRAPAEQRPRTSVRWRPLEPARRDAAKRFAVEALAEDPSHAGARTLPPGPRAPGAGRHAGRDAAPAGISGRSDVCRDRTGLIAGRRANVDRGWEHVGRRRRHAGRQRGNRGRRRHHGRQREHVCREWEDIGRRRENLGRRDGRHPRREDRRRFVG